MGDLQDKLTNDSTDEPLNASFLHSVYACTSD